MSDPTTVTAERDALVARIGEVLAVLDAHDALPLPVRINASADYLGSRVRRALTEEGPVSISDRCGVCYKPGPMMCSGCAQGALPAGRACCFTSGLDCITDPCIACPTVRARPED